MRTIQSELTEKGYSKPMKDSHMAKQIKVKENLSERDLKELMGSNRTTYTRGKGGAIRNKR